MRLNVILDVYRLKIKVFLGAFRASKASIALLFIYILGFLPSMVALSSTITNALRQEAVAGLCVDVLAAAVSVIMAAAILLSLRGVTVFEYEQNIVFTSLLYPAEFSIASLLANLTYLLIFAFPLLLLYTLLVLSLSLSHFQATIIFLISFLLALSIIFLKMFLSLVKAFYRRTWVNALMLIIAFILILPVVGIFTQSPLRYNALPYPQSLFARIIVDTILMGGFHLPDLLGFLLFFTTSLALFSLTSIRNYFPFTTQIPLVSPFDISSRSQTFKMESSIKLFSKISVPLHLDPESKSLLNFLIKKEIIRLTREGSLFSIILMYVIISIVFLAIGNQSISGVESLPTFIVISLSSYSIIIPVMLTGNWRILEAKNLWLPISSGGDLRLIIKATLYSFIIISLSVPLIIMLPALIIFRINPIPALVILVSTSLVGCLVNFYVAVKFLKGKRRGAPSFFIGWLSILLAIPLISPAYVSIALFLIFDQWAAFCAILLSISAYLIILMKVFLKLIENNIHSIEL